MNTLSIISIILIFFFSCSKQETKNVSETKHKLDSTKTFSLTENQKKVLRGAKKCLEAGFKYDNEMAYHVLKYRDGEFIGTKVYPNGDLDPALGVCTEVTIRALRWGGVCDLQKEIHNDLKENWNDYPMSRWSAKKSDVNIDHRRVPNQLVWFKKNWKEVTELNAPPLRGGVGEGLLPGDVVIWDMNGDSWADHIGIISDNLTPNLPKEEGERYMVIHNFPSPGYVAEEDVLNHWEIIGVFRVKE